MEMEVNFIFPRKEPNVVCFNKPEGEYGFLNNWYPSPFEYAGIPFLCVEHCMLFLKSNLFEDEAGILWSLRISDISDLKKYSYEVKGYDVSIWNGKKQILLYHVLQEKFRQNPELRDKLTETLSDVLAYCSEDDRDWGIGLSIDDPKRLSIVDWKGSNLLGYTLMMVRDEFLVF